VPTTVEVFVPLSELPLARDAVTPVARARELVASDVAVHEPPPALLLPADDPDAGARSGAAPTLTSLAVRLAAAQAGIGTRQLGGARLLRRSLDARKGFPLGFRVQVEVYSQREVGHGGPGLQPPTPWPLRLPPPKKLPELGKKRVIVVGSGPAGTFCALRLAEAGAEVVIVEQGKPVQPRRRDLARTTRGEVVPDSNYCFGEGGAGTFSDGKLYTRSKDRAAIGETLATLIAHGADPDIAVDSRPHIGSNRLPQILVGLREDLTRRGVSYHFSQTVTDLLVSPSGAVTGVRCESGLELPGDAVVLAVGHSARGIYELLFRRGATLEPKAFAIGARVEHPQPLIDRIQYGRAAEHPALPAAFYNVAAQHEGRGVYSFCMCPGGWVVPSATEPEGLCTNGMSLKRRDSPLANAALVVSVEPADYAHFARPGVTNDPLAGVEFQRAVERKAFHDGGGGLVAVAQSVWDFLDGKPSETALSSTYRPRVVPGDVGAALPGPVREALRGSLRTLGRNLPGFVPKDAAAGRGPGGHAQLVGVETRTSSPLRIVRGDSLMSPSLPNLYPAGEGAGYAGGIVSAAIDGLRVADAILARWLA